jgi:hypothetical protein
MNILFIFGEQLTIGGHFLSAQALAKKLSIQGHHVHAYMEGEKGGVLDEFRTAGTEVHLRKRDISDRMQAGSIRTVVRMFCEVRTLTKLIRAHHIHALHCQDIGFIRFAYLAAALTHTKLVCTQAGGRFRNHLFPMAAPLVVYSRELYEAYDALMPPYRPKNVICMRERMDFDIYRQRVGQRDSFRKRHGIGEGTLLLLMAIRLHKQKKPWIDSFFAMADRLEVPCPVIMIIAGDGDLREYVSERSNAFNRIHEAAAIRQIGPILDPGEMGLWMSSADAVIGNGRGLIEGLACGAAAIVLGENGEAELIQSHNVEHIAHWNFSGRHFRHCDEKRPLKTGRWCISKDEMRSAAIQGQAYVRANYDARVGAEKLNDIYRKADKCRLRDWAKWELFRLRHRRMLKNGGKVA